MLIRTKITTPPLRRNMVNRQRLIDRLEQGKNRPLILVCGHAGSGKTFLTTQWLKQYKNAVAWYSLDEYDNDPDLFFRYLLTALLGHGNKIDKALSPFLQGQANLSGLKVTAKILDAFSQHTKEIFLILDDYHVINNKIIHDAVFHLVQYAARSLHLVILSRSEPYLPLSRLRARNHITEVNANDLQFRQDEVAVFFKDVMQLDLPSDQIQSIFRITEGWASGIQLAGLAAHQHPSSDLLNVSSLGSNPVVSEYLKNEVLNAQPENVKTFLLKTSILNRFNADLCREITGLDNTHEILKELEQNNIFIIAMDPAHEWYRYHPLFAEFLKKHLMKTRQEDIVSQNKKAALWNAQNHCIEEAFYHAWASRDMDFIVSLMEDYLMIYIVSCEFVSALRWLNKLPQKIYMESFILQVYRLLIFITQWDLIQASQLMENLKRDRPHLMQKYSGKKKKSAQDLWIVAKHSKALAQGTQCFDIETLYNDLGNIGVENRLVYLFLADFVPWLHMNMGDVAPAMSPVMNNLKLYKEMKISFGVFNTLKSYTEIEIIMGHMSRAETRWYEEIQKIKQAGIFSLPFRADYYLMKSKIYYFKNELENALENIDSALEYLEDTQLNIFKYEVYVQMAYILHAIGRESTATHTMEKALLKSQNMGSPHFVSIAQSEMARLALFQDNQPIAQKWSKARNLNIQEPFSDSFESDCLIQAHLLIDQGRYKDAFSLLNALRPRSVKRQRREPVLRIDILRAAALDAMGERKRAIEILELALCFAMPEKYIQQFIIFSPYIADMLMALGSAKDQLVVDYAVTMCEHCGIAKPTSLPKGNIPISTTESLTPREADILKMMTHGHSNSEIGDRLFISINTVKFYNKSLFAKLGVKNRVQAGIKARKLKIL